MHIAAVDPRYVRREDVTPEMLEREREIYAAQGAGYRQADAVIQKIVTGKMEKFYEETCLYEQHFIKDETMTIGRRSPRRSPNSARTSRFGASPALRLAKFPNQIGTPAPEQA